MNSRLHFFSIMALNPEPVQSELNRFMQQHRVVTVEKQWVADGAASFWSICLTVVEGSEPLPTALRAPNSQQNRKRAKIDYREVLNETDFSVYAELRNLRANIAKAEGVPVYALFSNEQLACMVRQRVTTVTQLRDIEGVGEARVGKYAQVFLPLLQEKFASMNLE